MVELSKIAGTVSKDKPKSKSNSKPRSNDPDNPNWMFCNPCVQRGCTAECDYRQEVFLGGLVRPGQEVKCKPCAQENKTCQPAGWKSKQTNSGATMPQVEQPCAEEKDSSVQQQIPASIKSALMSGELRNRLVKERVAETRAQGKTPDPRVTGIRTIAGIRLNTEKLTTLPPRGLPAALYKGTYPHQEPQVQQPPVTQERRRGRPHQRTVRAAQGEVRTKAQLRKQVEENKEPEEGQKRGEANPSEEAKCDQSEDT